MAEASNSCQSDPWISIARNLLDYQFFSRKSSLRHQTIQLLTSLPLPSPMIDKSREISFIPKLAHSSSSVMTNSMLEVIGLDYVLQEITNIGTRSDKPRDETPSPAVCSSCFTDCSPYWTCSHDGKTLCESCHNQDMLFSFIQPYLTDISEVLKQSAEQEDTLNRERKAIGGNMDLLRRFYSSYTGGLSSNGGERKSRSSKSVKKNEKPANKLNENDKSN